MDPCPGAGKVARRQRVRNLATAILERTPLGLLTLALLALAACAHAPARPRESSPPQLVTTAPDAIPVAVAAPAASTGATGGSTPEPIAPTVAPEASTAAAMPETTPAASPAPAPALDAAPTQLAGLAPDQYGDLFDRMRAGFKLEDGTDRRAVDQQLRWYASNPEYLQRAFGRADLYL